MQLWHREPEVHHPSFHMYVRESPKKHSKAYTNTDSGNESCDFIWPRSATEGLRVVVLVGHIGKGQEEPWRKAKVVPRGHG